MELVAQSDVKFGMEKQSGIYEIRNTANGKRYIGSAKQFGERWKRHLQKLRSGKHHSRHLQSAWNKYGAGAFKFLPILGCTKSMLLFYEQQLLDKAKPEYNICKFAGNTLGTKRSPEFCAALGERMKGRKFALGLKRTPEQRAAMSIARRGAVLSAEHKEKISIGGRGLKRSEETKARMAKAQKGNTKGVGKRSAEFSANQSARLKGNTFGLGVKRPRTPEHTANIVASRAANKAARAVREGAA